MTLTWIWPAGRSADAPTLPGRYKGTRHRREPPAVARCAKCEARLPRAAKAPLCRNCQAIADEN